jgi:hypothetical protein
MDVLMHHIVSCCIIDHCKVTAVVGVCTLTAVMVCNVTVVMICIVTAVVGVPAAEHRASSDGAAAAVPAAPGS